VVRALRPAGPRLPHGTSRGVPDRRFQPRISGGEGRRGFRPHRRGSRPQGGGQALRAVPDLRGRGPGEVDDHHGARPHRVRARAHRAHWLRVRLPQGDRAPRRAAGDDDRACAPQRRHAADRDRAVQPQLLRARPGADGPRHERALRVRPAGDDGPRAGPAGAAARPRARVPERASAETERLHRAHGLRKHARALRHPRREPQGGHRRAHPGRPALEKLVFWSIRTTACPEPYVKLRVEPGREEAWTLRYELYELEKPRAAPGATR
jgi:hypothetical protein